MQLNGTCARPTNQEEWRKVEDFYIAHGILWADGDRRASYVSDSVILCNNGRLKYRTTSTASDLDDITVVAINFKPRFSRSLRKTIMMFEHHPSLYVAPITALLMWLVDVFVPYSAFTNSHGDNPSTPLYLFILFLIATILRYVLSACYYGLSSWFSELQSTWRKL